MQTAAKLRAWLQLLRAPNLLTVPGDPVAGAFLVAGASTPLWPVAGAVAIALALYAAGLILNDIADLDEDRRERPERPLASGRIGMRAARGAVAVLIVGAFCGAAVLGWRVLFIALALAACVYVYSYGVKQRPVLGPVMMGICRGLSLLLGAVAVRTNYFTGLELPAAGLLVLYIALVTGVARRETRPGRPGWIVFAPVFVPVAMVALFVWLAWDLAEKEGAAVEAWFALPLIAWSGVSTAAAIRAYCGEVSLPPVIGVFIRCLLLFQAALCLTGGAPGMVAAGVLVALYPVSALAGKYFYAS